jgi:hypothetical protein
MLAAAAADDENLHEEVNAGNVSLARQVRM